MDSVDNDGMVTLAVPVTEETEFIVDVKERDETVIIAPALPEAVPTDVEEVKPLIAPVVESPVIDNDPTCASEFNESRVTVMDNFTDIVPNFKLIMSFHCL